MCSAVMQSFGNGKSVSIPLPPTWRYHLIKYGIKCSKFYCNINLFIEAFRELVIGFIKSVYLTFPFNTQKCPSCPYVVFTHLQQNNLPTSSNKKSYNIISWYKQSIIREPNINKYWAQVKVDREYLPPDDLIIDGTVLPRLANTFMYIKYFIRNTISVFVSLFGLLIGKWWYGYLYRESIFLNYIHCLKDEQLADHYYFSVANWYYEPLWAHETEARGKSVSLYSYSVNMHKRRRDEYKYPDTYGTKNMLWNNFIVWDKEQVEFWIRYRPKANFTIVGFICNTGMVYAPVSRTKKKTLSIFDVTPTRPSFYTSLGFGYPPYSEEMNISFLEDIISVFSDGNWEIFWKPKRIVGPHFISPAFIRKRMKLFGDDLIQVNPEIAAVSLIESSDAVISMPFTSPSVIAKNKDIVTDTMILQVI